MVILRPWSSAKPTMSGQTRSASSQLSSGFFGAVRAHERVDVRDAHRLGGGDDVPQVADDLGPMVRVGVERVRVVAETRDRQALGGDLVRRSPWPGSPTGSRRRCGMCPAYRRVGPVVRGQQAISMLSKPLAAVQSATSMSGVSGNGAVSRPSFMVSRLHGVADGDGVANDVDPAARAGRSRRWRR